MKVLNFILPVHLAEICNLCLAPSSRITLRINGVVAQEFTIEWPLDFIVGKKDIFGGSRQLILH